MKHRKAVWRAGDLQKVASATPHEPALVIGEDVRLNSGGPVGLVVDVAGDRVVIAWPRRHLEPLEIDLPSICVRRCC